MMKNESVDEALSDPGPMEQPRMRVKVPPPRPPSPCECADPGCPVCHGHCRHRGELVVRNIDDEVGSGFKMCQGCAEDALESGIFTTDESRAAWIANTLLEATQNNFNPKGLKRDRHGNLVDKYGRKMEVDWDTFKKRRGKVQNPINAAVSYPVKEALKPMAKVNVSPTEKRMGRKVEREHSTDSRTADIIASHHHKEREDYYAKLKKAGLANELD